MDVKDIWQQVKTGKMEGRGEESRAVVMVFHAITKKCDLAPNIGVDC